MGIIDDVSQTILDGFNLHYELFRQFSARARIHFENNDIIKAMFFYEKVLSSTDKTTVKYDANYFRAMEGKVLCLEFMGANDESIKWAFEYKTLAYKSGIDSLKFSAHEKIAWLRMDMQNLELAQEEIAYVWSL